MKCPSLLIRKVFPINIFLPFLKSISFFISSHTKLIKSIRLSLIFLRTYWHLIDCYEVNIYHHYTRLTIYINKRFLKKSTIFIYKKKSTRSCGMLVEWISNKFYNHHQPILGGFIILKSAYIFISSSNLRLKSPSTIVLSRIVSNFLRWICIVLWPRSVVGCSFKIQTYKFCIIWILFSAVDIVAGRIGLLIILTSSLQFGHLTPSQ